MSKLERIDPSYLEHLGGKAVIRQNVASLFREKASVNEWQVDDMANALNTAREDVALILSGELGLLNDQHTYGSFIRGMMGVLGMSAGRFLSELQVDQSLVDDFVRSDSKGGKRVLAWSRHKGEKYDDEGLTKTRNDFASAILDTIEDDYFLSSLEEEMVS